MSKEPRIRRPSPGRVWLRLALVLACACALAAPLTAGADSQAESVISTGLLDAARAHPNAPFEVIVAAEGDGDAVAAEVRNVATDAAVEETFDTVPAVAATLTGSDIVTLAEGSDPLVITRDAAVSAADDTTQGTSPIPSDEPTISGDPEPGVELTATPGRFSNTAEIAYQWQRCEIGLPVQTTHDARTPDGGCTAILGAQGATYRVDPDDRGLGLRVVVTSHEPPEALASAVTPPVTARPPTAIAPPSILGTSEKGQTLEAANGIWVGTMLGEYEHQWQRCDEDGDDCDEIWGATGSSYKLRWRDVGATIRVAVNVEGLAGEGVAVSEATPVVIDIPRRLPRFKQHWPYVAGVAPLLESLEGQALEPPTIAIVDSGIDEGRADFGGRVIERVPLSSRGANTPGDGNGHGTAVASLAAGDGPGYTGAAPNAKLVDVDVLDDEGAANISDVIAAADWIYNHHERLNIRVANFSLHGTSVASLASDPLDKAVERLWLSGIVVVTAAGNYAVDGAESAVPFAPANDPFVITVGATDTRGSYTVRDDIAAPWSAWGYTRDGFAKPELAAPGRYIAAAVSGNAKLARDKPDRIAEPGYMQLSGTSLSAPVVAGTAATLLAVHPEWTPDQVKGALMLSAEPLPKAPPRAVGVGTVNAASAAALVDPPNPNLALNNFLVPDPAGGPTRVFDADTWTAAAQADPAWASVAWGSVAWGSAAWSSVAWGSVAWGSVAWGSVAWGSVAWGSVAWGSHADDDVRPEGSYWTEEE